MITYGNQKVITISKPVSYNENFVLCSQEAMFAAMRDLNETKAGFALWMYLVKNQPNHKTGLSSKDFMTVSGYKIKAYNSAVEALIEKGYLVQSGEYSYIFYEKKLMPSKDKDNKECRNTFGTVPYPLGAQETCAVREYSLSSESTRNNINNINNNINKIKQGKMRMSLEEVAANFEDRPWFVEDGIVYFEDCDLIIELI